jgi:hypothetical protein
VTELEAKSGEAKSGEAESGPGAPPAFVYALTRAHPQEEAVQDWARAVRSVYDEARAFYDEARARQGQDALGACRRMLLQTSPAPTA